MKNNWIFTILFLAFPILYGTASPEIDEQESYPKEFHRAFQKGEFLKYNIHYGLVDAGLATFSVKDTNISVKKQPHYYLKVTGRSYKAWDSFFKVRDYYYSLVNQKTMLPTAYSRNIREGDFRNIESYYFDRQKQQAKGKTDGDAKVIEIPPNVHDLVSMIYFARSVDFRNKPDGYFMPMPVFFESEWFECGVRRDGIEVIETELGKFECLKVVPKLVKGRVFKGQEDMVVYVSNDENMVPIRIESKIFVGSIKVDLIEYENLLYPLKNLE